MNCKLCHKEIEKDCYDYDELVDVLSNQIDTYGIDSLTEKEQLFMEGKICCDCCNIVEDTRLIFKI